MENDEIDFKVEILPGLNDEMMLINFKRRINGFLIQTQSALNARELEMNEKQFAHLQRYLMHTMNDLSFELAHFVTKRLRHHH